MLSLPSHLNVNGTILGLDFGLKRIGIATGHTQTALAHPHSTLQRSVDISVSPSLIALVKEWQPVAFVVGYPTHADGRSDPHPLQPACQQFAQDLADNFARPVALINEQLSSYAAEQSYRQHHKGPLSKQNKAKLDAYAAQHILQDFLDGAPPYQWIEPAQTP